uniref:Uncharacterized protein n=1 Tax=Pseudomonas phage RVTF4 TaxID=3236931 RepID=A0AB39CCR6_9VIRU
MVNEVEIKEHLQAHATIFQMSLSDFIVTAGAALVLHGLREETNDIDVDIHLRDYSLIKGNFPMHRLSPCLFGETMSIGTLLDIHMYEARPSTVVIDGMVVLSVDALLDQYTRMYDHPARQKDKREADAIAIGKLREIIDRRERAKPLTKETFNDAANEVAATLWQFSRIRNFMKGRAVGSHQAFHGPNGHLWFVMVTEGLNRMRMIDFYESEHRSSRGHEAHAQLNDPLLFKHGNNQHRFTCYID